MSAKKYHVRFTLKTFLSNNTICKIKKNITYMQKVAIFKKS